MFAQSEAVARRTRLTVTTQNVARVYYGVGAGREEAGVARAAAAAGHAHASVRYSNNFGRGVGVLPGARCREQAPSRRRAPSIDTEASRRFCRCSAGSTVPKRCVQMLYDA